MVVLSTLRTMICMGVAVLVWYVIVLAVPPAGNMLLTLMPVWLGGLAGGVVAVVFSARQGVSMAFTSGMVLMAIFLWYRHVVMDIALGTNTMLTLWPVWFPPTFYLGAYGYLMLKARSG
ncbi:MAG: hypothetical protein AAF541_16610 [Pseudomonadota bacterium]